MAATNSFSQNVVSVINLPAGLVASKMLEPARAEDPGLDNY
jgi:hypothetical protein